MLRRPARAYGCCAAVARAAAVTGVPYAAGARVVWRIAVAYRRRNVPWPPAPPTPMLSPPAIIEPMTSPLMPQ